MPVERELGGTHAAIRYIIRGANHKSLLDIHREIRAFQARPIPPGQGMPPVFRFLMAAPGRCPGWASGSSAPPADATPPVWCRRRARSG